MPIDYFETTDVASGPNTTARISVGDSFSGTINGGSSRDPSWRLKDRDAIGLEVVEGKSYRVIGSFAAQSLHSEFSLSLDQGIDFQLLGPGAVSTEVERGEFVAPYSGTVFLTVATNPKFPMLEEAYTISLEEREVFDFANDSTPGPNTTLQIEPGQGFRTLWRDQGQDWVEIELRQGEIYQFSIGGTRELNPLLRDSDGNALIGDFQYSGSGSVFRPPVTEQFVAPYTGKYYLHANKYFGMYGGDLNYSLYIDGYGTSGPREITDAVGNSSTSYEISGGESFFGDLTFSDDDGVNLNVLGGYIYQITVTEPGENTEAQLLLTLQDTTGSDPLENMSFTSELNGEASLFTYIDTNAAPEITAVINLYSRLTTAYYELSLSDPIESATIGLSELSDLPSNVHSSINPLQVGDQFVGFAESRTPDLDFIPIYLSADVFYEFGLSGTGPQPFSNPHIRLYNSDGVQIWGEYNNYFTEEETYRFAVDTDGVYFFSVGIRTSQGHHQSFYDLSTDFYDFILLGTSEDDSRTGITGSEFIDGFEGNDSLYGLGGDDTIYGRSGDDFIHGTGYLNGGTGDDRIVVYHVGNATILGGKGDDIIEGWSQNDWINGGSGDDKISGGEGHDFLRGSRGSDTIYAGDGDDFVAGQRNADYLFGGRGEDYMIGGGGYDYLFGDYGSDFLKGGTGNDTLEGDFGNDTLIGNRGNDILDGGIGDDLMVAGGGDDRLIATGHGDDRMRGGEGHDTFVFTYHLSGPLQIHPVSDNIIDDFNVSEDRIEISISQAGNSSLDGVSFRVQSDGVLIEIASSETILLSGLNDTVGLIDAFDIFS